MASVSLNTSITSTHKDNFYSGVGIDSNNNPWAMVYPLVGSWFGAGGESSPNDNMNFDLRVGNNTSTWLSLGGCYLGGYYGYAYCQWNSPGVNAFYYNFSNPSDANNYYFIDKIKCSYGGFVVESYLNRTTLQVHVTDTSNTAISGASITLGYLDTVYIISPSGATATTDSNGNASVSFFNPPKYPWSPTTYRTYNINVSKSGTSPNSKDEIISNIDYYPLNIQLSCVALGVAMKIDS